MNAPWGSMMDFIQVKKDLLLVHEGKGGLLHRDPYLESIPFRVSIF